MLSSHKQAHDLKNMHFIFCIYNIPDLPKLILFFCNISVRDRTKHVACTQLWQMKCLKTHSIENIPTEILIWNHTIYINVKLSEKHKFPTKFIEINCIVLHSPRYDVMENKFYLNTYSHCKSIAYIHSVCMYVYIME